MKYGLFAAIAFAFVALVGGTASAGVATSGLTNATVGPLGFDRPGSGLEEQEVLSPLPPPWPQPLALPQALRCGSWW